jgi:Cd2+/Zn2+-exporting ATPase
MSATAAVESARVCQRCTLHAESVFRIDGLCCGEEAAILRRRLQPLSGVEDVAADVVGQRLHVKYDAAVLSTNAIVDAVAETGMRAWLEHEQPLVPPSSRARGVLVAVSAAALALGLGMQFVERLAPWSVLAFAIGAVAGGVFPARRAVHSLRARELDINTLMLVAVVGAMVLGEWAEAATVVFLFAVAQWLESRSMDRARDAVRALMALTPDQARVRHEGGGETLVPVDLIDPGTVMLIRPGEKIPLDGAVVAGQSDVNQAPITGESLPVDKAPGEPMQQFIDRFARWYTPVVIVLAIAVATVPPVIVGSGETWFYRALVLLVVSCPCALVISTPVSVVSALAGAARRGVLVKGGIHLERLAAVRAIAFDKTGTLTRGTVGVVGVHAAPGVTESELLATAAAVETRSEHPIAEAIVAEARNRGLAIPVATAVRALPGLGLEGDVGGEVLCGNVRLFRERGLLDAQSAVQAEAIAASGASPVIVAWNQRLLGAIAVADHLREVAADAIDLLHQQHLKPIVMLTGDQEPAARAIASRLRIDDVRAGLLPHEKVAAVHELRRQYGAIAMVGDGVNDAPAVAAADVGIAMGAIGSDAALETADVVLMNDELPKIAYAIRLSRATVRNIRANVAISLLLKAAFLALAIGGMATLWMAVIADTGTSLIVIANAMRLLRHG